MLKTFENRSAFDVVNIAAGLGLAITPWILGYAALTTAAWNAWLVGAAIAVVACIALFAFSEWQQWVNTALGVWTVAAPWLLSFSTNSSATISHVVVGLIVAAAAGYSLWNNSDKPFSTA